MVDLVVLVLFLHEHGQAYGLSSFRTEWDVCVGGRRVGRWVL